MPCGRKRHLDLSPVRNFEPLNPKDLNQEAMLVGDRLHNDDMDHVDGNIESNVSKTIFHDFDDIHPTSLESNFIEKLSDFTSVISL